MFAVYAYVRVLLCGEELSVFLPHGGVQVHTKPAWLTPALKCFVVMW